MRYLFILAAFISSSFSLTDNGKADAICGKWMSAEKNLAVEVYREQGSYKAKIIYFTGGVTKDKPMETITDKHNPNPALRDRKVLGLNILEGMTYKGDNTWDDGKIYEVQSGKTWSAAARLEGANQLKVKGYWHVKLIGRTLVFNRF